MAIRRKLLTVVLALTIGIGVAAGTGVVDPVSAAQTQVCEPSGENVSQNESVSKDQLFEENSSDEESELTPRANGTDGDDMKAIDGEALVGLALEFIAEDVVCDVETDPSAGSINGTAVNTVRPPATETATPANATATPTGTPTNTDTGS